MKIKSSLLTAVAPFPKKTSFFGTKGRVLPPVLPPLPKGNYTDTLPAADVVRCNWFDFTEHHDRYASDATMKSAGRGTALAVVGFLKGGVSHKTDGGIPKGRHYKKGSTDFGLLHRDHH